MKKRYALRLLPLLFFFSTSWKFTEEKDLLTILKEADFHRGGQIKGISWDLHVLNYEQGRLKNKLTLFVEASSVEERQFALIAFLEPKKFKGQKLLLRDNNMWFSKIDLRQPVAISNRQRLSGSAANADVASANYYNDYTIISAKEELLDGQACWVLALEAKNSLVPYLRIDYWITKQEHLGIQTLFYGKSSKLIKSARFEYTNAVAYHTKKENFISKITIRDNINTENQTILNISNIRFDSFSHAKFQKDRLQD